MTKQWIREQRDHSVNIERLPVDIEGRLGMSIRRSR